MRRCAQSMTNLTNLKLNNSEQHVEMGQSRILRDLNGAHKLYGWFKVHNPDDFRLCSLFSMIVVDTEVIGSMIHAALDQVELGKAKIKRKDAIKNLDSLYNNVTVGTKTSIY